MLNTIYKITNIINGKVYIGKTMYTIEERFNEHKKDYQKIEEKNRPLYRAMNKYGLNNFKIEIVETDIPDELINEKEIYYIKYYNSYVGFPNSNGYNATLGGDGKKYKDYNIQEIINKYNECKNLTETGKCFNLDHSFIRKLLLANNVKLLTTEEIKQKQGKDFGHKIYQIDLNEDIILNTFNSKAEASRYMGKNSNNGTIHDACQARRGHHKAYGYRWYYQEEWDNK